MSEDRIPPMNIEVEEAVLGSILQEQDCLFEHMVSLHDSLFYKESHRLIFLSIKTLFDKRQNVDLLTVMQQLKNSNNLEAVGGTYYLSQLTNKISSSSNIEHHILILKELFLKREIIRICGMAMDKAYSFETDALEHYEEVENQITGLNQYLVGREEEHDTGDELETRYQYNILKRESIITGVHSGNFRLDEFTKGWQKKDLIVLAARSSMGKTAKAIDLAIHASKNGFKPLIFSLEMGREFIYDRMLLSEAALKARVVKNHEWDEEKMNRYSQAKDTLKRSGIYVIEKSKAKPNYVRAATKTRMRKYGCDIVFIDYLQLMEGNKHNNNREQEVASISRELKAIAKELNIPIIALSQLSREVEKRPSKRPILSDLRESGSIEQDADLVIFIYRPSTYWEKSTDPDYNGSTMSDEEYDALTEIIIAKHRNGALGRIKEYFLKDQSKFITDFVPTTINQEMPF